MSLKQLANLAMSLCCLPEGRPSPVLKEVQLDLVNPAKCRHVLQTVKGSVLNQRLGRSHMTVLCAGPERGGKDACQVGKLSICHPSICPPIHLSTIHLPFCREIQGVLWCAQQGPVVGTGWRLVLRPGVKDVVGVGVTTAAAIHPKEDPRVCSPMSGSCCLGSSKDWERVGPGQLFMRWFKLPNTTKGRNHIQAMPVQNWTGFPQEYLIYLSRIN